MHYETDDDKLTAQRSTIGEFKSLAGPMFGALEQSPMPIVVTDPTLPDNPVIFANKAFTTLSGYMPADIVGRNCRILQGVDTSTEVIAQISDALRNSQPIEFEILNYRKHGTAFRNGVSIFPVFSDGRLRFFASTQTGLAQHGERSHAEAELQASQKRLDEVNERLRITLSLTGAAAA